MAQNGTMPRLATLVEERRAAHDNPTFLFGGGDEVSPHSMSPISAWETPIDVLNELDPDAADSPDDPATTDESSSTTPGFGVAVALVAVLGAALVALRE